MAYILVTTTVDDFEEWKASFEEYTPARQEHGVLAHGIFRASDDPNDVVVLEQFESAEHARSWDEYLSEGDRLSEEGMSDTEIRHVELVEGQSMIPPAE